MSERRKNDFYPTPARGTEVLLEYKPEIVQPAMFEACVGDGAISNVLSQHGYVITNDIDEDMPATYHYDAQYIKLNGWFSVITNPPFLVAFEIAKNFIEQEKICAFLLRLSFLEPTKKRGEWLSEHPPSGMIVLPRISFTGDGKTDSVTCAWMLWNVEPFQTIIVPKEKFYCLESKG